MTGKRLHIKADRELWLKIIPIALTAIGLFFSILKGCDYPPNLNEQETWKQMKQTYKEMSSLAGRIGAAKVNGNDSLLRLLSQEFDSYYLGDMRKADSRVEHQMMVLKRDLDDALQNRVDYFNRDALRNSCLHLQDSIKLSITEGDQKFGR